MTVYPQRYKLNCNKIGFPRYSISMSIGNTALVDYTNCDDANSPCDGTEIINRITKNYVEKKYTVTVTWDGMNVNSGSISQSTTGDQMYQCVLKVTDQPTRIRNVTIKGDKL